jgi:hypothetical protein
MQTTIRNLTSQRVADPEAAEGKAWVVREHRLRDLEYHGGAATSSEVPRGGRRRAHAARRRVAEALAS